MLLKVRRQHREKLQTVIGTGQKHAIKGFSDEDSDEEEETKMHSAMSGTATPKTFRTPMKTPSKKIRAIKATPSASRKPATKKLGGVFDKVIV